MKILDVVFQPKYAQNDVVTVLRDAIIYDSNLKPVVIPKHTILTIKDIKTGHYTGLYKGNKITAEIEELDSKTQKRTA